MAAFRSWTKVDFVRPTFRTGFRYRPTRSTVFFSWSFQQWSITRYRFKLKRFWRTSQALEKQFCVCCTFSYTKTTSISHKNIPWKKCSTQNFQKLFRCFLIFSTIFFIDPEGPKLETLDSGRIFYRCSVKLFTTSFLVFNILVYRES